MNAGELSAAYLRHYISCDGEERLARTDEAGTSARFFDCPPREQEGGYDDPTLAYRQDGLLPRERLSDVYDLLAGDRNAPIPAQWLVPWPEASGSTDAPMHS